MLLTLHHVTFMCCVLVGKMPQSVFAFQHVSASSAMQVAMAQVLGVSVELFKQGVSEYLHNMCACLHPQVASGACMTSPCVHLHMLHAYMHAAMLASLQGCVCLQQAGSAFDSLQL